MKKLVKNLPIKRLKRKAPEAPPSRITNETVAEHRERILAGGRKFKYPVQYSRHKLVFNAIIISVAAAILLGVIGWWQLYPMQNSSALMYRITRLVPLPVAKVDGEAVLYRDYLVLYRGSEYYLANAPGEVKLNTPDGKRQLDYIKRQSLDKAEQIAYARKLSRQLNVNVTRGDIDSFIDQERNAANGKTSQETYDASMEMLYGQTTDDYRLSLANAILKTKVAFATDAAAAEKVKKAEALIKASDGDFAKVAEQLGGKTIVGQSGMVDVTGKFRGLRVAEVAKLEIGGLSGALRSTTSEGYSFVRVVNKTDSQVDFLYLHIPLSKFDADFAALKKAGKIQEYINVANQ